MIAAYLYYPNPRITIHKSAACSMIRMQHKTGQRRILISTENKFAELERFEKEEHRFGSTSELNDMWLWVDLGDAVAEQAVVESIKRTLSRRYGRFGRAQISEHC